MWGGGSAFVASMALEVSRPRTVLGGGRCVGGWGGGTILFWGVHKSHSQFNAEKSKFKG